jgi:hypothetical protein
LQKDKAKLNPLITWKLQKEMIRYYHDTPILDNHKAPQAIVCIVPCVIQQQNIFHTWMLLPVWRWKKICNHDQSWEWLSWKHQALDYQIIPLLMPGYPCCTIPSVVTQLFMIIFISTKSLFLLHHLCLSSSLLQIVQLQCIQWYDFKERFFQPHFERIRM